jgi:2-polyprenyl-3-methyl-5-hydroxy-6-metoxy-1,4-benzoquinol methylase
MPICLVCKSNNVEVWSVVRDEEYHTFKGENFHYYLCKNCRVISLSPTLENKLDVIYPSNYYSFNNDGYNILFKVKFFLDARNFRKLSIYFEKKSLRMLDVGGGIGRLSSIVKNSLPNLQIDSTIVDLDEQAGERALLEGHNYVKSSFEDAKFDEKFDLILAFNILEHVPDPIEFMNQVYDSLNDGGICLLQTPNFDSLDAKLFKKKYWGGLHAPRHFVLFDEKSLADVIKGSSLKIIKQSRVPGGPFWSYSILGTLNHMRNVYISTPLYNAKSYTLLTALFSAFDFFRRPLMKTSQQLVICQKLGSE